MATTEPAPPSYERSDVLRATVLTIVAHGAVLLALVALLVFEVPRLQEMFRKTRMALPEQTKLAIRAANLTKLYGLFLVPVFLGFDAAVFALLRTHAKTRTLSVVWSTVVLVGLLLCMVLTVEGLQAHLRPRYPTANLGTLGAHGPCAAARDGAPARMSGHR